MLKFSDVQTHTMIENKDRKYGLSLTELTTALEKADKYDKIEKWLKKEIKYTRKNMPFLYKND